MCGVSMIIGVPKEIKNHEEAKRWLRGAGWSTRSANPEGCLT
jgi:hypothetical protein